MLQVYSSLIKNAVQNVECVLFPPKSNKEEIPLDATFKIIILLILITIVNVFHIKVFPDPPKRYKKNNPPFCESTLS